jgi:hypothetical protein
MEIAHVEIPTSNSLHYRLRISLPIFPVNLFLPFFRPSIYNCSQRLSTLLVAVKTPHHYIIKRQPVLLSARIPAKMPGRVVEFVSAFNTICRPARDDERDVMQRFVAYTSHCPHCKDPYRVYMEGGTLCERGHAYARDIAQYVYSKAGKAYSVIDRCATDARVQIEIPVKCDAIRGLLKAVEHGLKVRGPALRPVVTHDRAYCCAQQTG